jgi:membrane protein
MARIRREDIYADGVKYVYDYDPDAPLKLVGLGILGAILYGILIFFLELILSVYHVIPFLTIAISLNVFINKMSTKYLNSIVAKIIIIATKIFTILFCVEIIALSIYGIAKNINNVGELIGITFVDYAINSIVSFFVDAHFDVKSGLIEYAKYIAKLKYNAIYMFFVNTICIVTCTLVSGLIAYVYNGFLESNKKFRIAYYVISFLISALYIQYNSKFVKFILENEIFFYVIVPIFTTVYIITAIFTKISTFSAKDSVVAYCLAITFVSVLLFWIMDYNKYVDISEVYSFLSNIKNIAPYTMVCFMSSALSGFYLIYFALARLWRAGLPILFFPIIFLAGIFLGSGRYFMPQW